MSKVISLAGTNTATNVKIQQSAAILEFHFRTADANAIDLDTLLARMNNVKVNIELQTKNGQNEVLVPKMPLGALAEIYSGSESFIEVSDNGTDHDVVFGLELGRDGALAVNAESSLVVDITGTQSGDNLDVYALDAPVGTNRAIKTAALRLSANAPSVVNLNRAKSLHIPAASFDDLELQYPNGKTVTLEKKEIERWALEGNGMIACLVGVVANGWLDYYSLNVEDAISAKITNTADANAYISSVVNV